MAAANRRTFVSILKRNTSGKFEYTDYWWSNPVHKDLDSLKNFNTPEEYESLVRGLTEAGRSS